MDKREAERIVEQQLSLNQKGYAIMPEHTEEFATCFTIRFQSKHFVETRRFSDMVIGHGPVLVEKATGKIFETGSCYPMEHWIKVFEACGDPFATLTRYIKISNTQNADPKAAMRCLRKFINCMPLVTAKAHIDKAFTGGEVIIELDSETLVDEVINQLEQCGFLAAQLWSNQIK